MSIRTYCDVCGDQITEKNDLTAFQSMSTSAAKAGRRAMVKVYVSASVAALSQVYNSEEAPEHVCRHCVIDAVAKTDTRPKPAPPLPDIRHVPSSEIISEYIRRNLSIAPIPAIPS